MRVPRHHPPVSFMAQPTNCSLHGFEAQTKKPSRWFWGPNHQIVATDLRPKPGKPPPSGLRPNLEEPSPTALRPNWEKLSQWFWGQTTDKPPTLVLRLNQETCAPHLLVHGIDCTQYHPTSQSFGHWVPDMCDHPQSSAPGLLLLARSSSLSAMPYLPPTHHDTSKRDSPHDTKDKGELLKCLRFEFNPHQVNDLSQSNQGTDHLVSHT
jgi:hypothetical protein